jgi:integrase/recombinase XerD
MVSALRAFLRYAGKEGWCTDRLAESISRPRLYQHESLPYAPDFDRGASSDRAIVLLLALYGMRSRELLSIGRGEPSGSCV